MYFISRSPATRVMHMESSLWQKTQVLISQSVDAHRFQTWFQPLQQMDSANTSLLQLQAPDRFTADFLDHHYKNTILSFAKQVTRDILDVRFSFPDTSTHDARSSLSLPPKQQVTLLSQFTFDLFVVGAGNELAKSVSLAVAQAPGKTKFNPLLIYGGAGLGKTHLLHAIGNCALQENPRCIVNSTTSEEFYFAFVDAIKNSGTRDFSQGFRNSDLLLLDDVQFFAGKESTQEEFFYIFNTLYQNGKQIVLTSDLPPNSLKGLHSRLVSRFQWGLIVDIQPPDLETRVAILKKKAERDNLDISEEILYFIAENISSNVRELEGCIIHLLAFASIAKTDITLDLVKSLLFADGRKKQHSPISIDIIIQEVAQYYNVPVDTLREKNRTKEIAHSRQVAMYLAKTMTPSSLKTIGLHFGGRDHSTVIHALHTINKEISTNTTVARDIDHLLSQLH